MKDFYEVSKKGFKFLKESQDLGKITKPDEPLFFKFENFPKPYETYNGSLASIK